MTHPFPKSARKGRSLAPKQAVRQAAGAFVSLQDLPPSVPAATYFLKSSQP